MWAMRTGIVENPRWYFPLTQNSSFEEFQEHFHGVARYSIMCPTPCVARESAERLPAASSEPPAHTGCRTSVEGDACYTHLVHHMTSGILHHPERYPSLTKDSSAVQFQKFLHENTHRFPMGKELCPDPCAAAA